MASLQQKNHKAPSGAAYNYFIAPPQTNKPTILLLHGCPDSSSLWTNLIQNHLLPSGFGIISPDLIGYGLSSKPNNINPYFLDSICYDLISILDLENKEKVIPLGHDFGAVLASKLITYHPSRVAGLITLGTAHTPPSPEPFDFEKIRAMQEEYLGYCSGWYFPLYTFEKVYQLMDQHVEGMCTALHGGGERMNESCCYPEAFENWLKQEGAEDEAVMPYARNEEFRMEWVERLKRDGF